MSQQKILKALKAKQYVQLHIFHTLLSKNNARAVKIKSLYSVVLFVYYHFGYQ